MEQGCGSLQGLIMNPAPSIRLVGIHALSHLIALYVQVGDAHRILRFHCGDGVKSFRAGVEAASGSVGWCSEHYRSRERAKRWNHNKLHDSGAATATAFDDYACSKGHMSWTFRCILKGTVA